jgi:RNA polymerase sigma-70 factor (ECF subfamily)
MPHSDDELVALLREGDEEAAAEFDGRFRARVEAIASRRGLAPADAEDAAQEAIVDALRQIGEGRFRSQSSLSTWIYVIAGGKVADHWRRRSGETAVRPRPSAGWLAGEGRESSAETAAIVQQALDRLPPEEQLVLLLHDREGHTLAEIGRLLGLKKSAVWERLRRARSRFADEVRGSGRTPQRGRLRQMNG